MLESLPDELRFQPELCTDRYEREEPAGVIAEKPLLGLLCRLSDTRLVNLKRLLKTKEGIFEHGTHQRRLRTNYGEAGRGKEVF